jgi:threonine efflux protein
VDPADLGVVAGLYIAASVNPTPATLGLLAEAMSSGRKAGLAFGAGLYAGSVGWSILAAFGLGAFLAAHPPVASWLRVLGGVYLLALAYKALRGALRPGGVRVAQRQASRSLSRGFLRGVMLQTSNVQSVMFWAALFSVVVAPGLPPATLAQPLLLCAALGVVRFGGLALLFSTARMIRLWSRARRPIEGGVAMAFGVAGAALLLNR